MTTTDVLVHRRAATEQQNEPGLPDGLLADGFAGVGPLVAGVHIGPLREQPAGV